MGVNEFKNTVTEVSLREAGNPGGTGTEKIWKVADLLGTGKGRLAARILGGNGLGCDPEVFLLPNDTRVTFHPIPGVVSRAEQLLTLWTRLPWRSLIPGKPLGVAIALWSDGAQALRTGETLCQHPIDEQGNERNSVRKILD